MIDSNIRVGTVGELMNKLNELPSDAPVDYGYYALSFKQGVLVLSEYTFGVPEDKL